MPWATAKLKGVVIAETEFPQVFGGDVYFPPESVRWEYLSVSCHHHKDSQRQFNLSVNGTIILDAAWSYPDQSNCQRLESVKNHVAFAGIAPVMIKYKKNFRYARSDDSHSDASTVSSTPNSSAPSTPTLCYSMPTIQLTTCGSSIYDYRNNPFSLSRKGSHSSATSGWKGVGLPTVSEAEGYLEVDFCEAR